MSSQGGQSQGGLCKQGGWHASQSHHHKGEGRKTEGGKRNQRKRRKRRKKEGGSLQAVGQGMPVYRGSTLSRKSGEHWTMRGGALDKGALDRTVSSSALVARNPCLVVAWHQGGASKRRQRRQSRRKEGKAKGKKPKPPTKGKQERKKN